MNKIYIIQAYRWGKREAHSYPVSARKRKEAAISIAKSHADYCGGKYAVVVWECDSNIFDNEHDLKQVHYERSRQCTQDSLT